MSTNILLETVGWVGIVAVLLAYGLNSYQKLRSDSVVFYLLNLFGAALLIVYSFYKEANANVAINVVWVIIAAIGLLRLKRGATKS